jgi:hypothetical protein
MAQERPVTRAEFFNWMKTRANPSALFAPAGTLLGVLSEAGEELDDNWVPVCRITQVGHRPQPFHRGGHSFYLSVHDGTVSAHRAVCPEDGTVLWWSDARNCFYCAFCKEMFDTEGNGKDGDKKLSALDARVMEETVFLNLS